MGFEIIVACCILVAGCGSSESRLRDALVGKWSQSTDPALAQRAQLVTLATATGLDAQSLARCLDKMAPDSTHDMALLPVGAFVARRGSDAVWIIVCKWEWGTDSIETAGEKRWPTLGHICVWAFTMKGAEKVGYVTCG